MEPNNRQSQSKSHRSHGIIKQWNEARKYGIIYAPEGKRYFLHVSDVVDGTPELARRVTFDIGAARNATELQRAIDVQIGELVGGAL